MRGLPLLLSSAAFALSLAAFGISLTDRVRKDAIVEGAGEPLAMLGLRPQVMFPALEDPDGKHVNHAIALAHNWSWNKLSGWKRDDVKEPSVAVSMESWYRGLGELNFDMRPPAGYTDWLGGRAMGLAARYDGSFAILSVGGEPYSPGGSGAQIVAGRTADPIMTLFESEQTPERDALRVQRSDRSTSVSLRGGVRPGLAFGLGEQPADGSGEGVLRVSGLASEPILVVAGIGAEATLIASRPVAEDAQPRLRVSADGRFEWGDGASSHDLSLHRAEKGRLTLEGELTVSSLRIGSGAPVQGLQILAAEAAPEPVPPGDARDTVFDLPGLGASSLVFVNGPEQPRGLGMASARADGANRMIIRFTNASEQPLRPASGLYTVLVVEPAER